MKKLIALIVAVCLIFAVAISIPAIKEKTAEKSAAEPESAAETLSAAEPDAVAEPVTEADSVQAEGIDYAAIYALHDADEVVAIIDGKPLTWQNYFSWYYLNAQQMENYFQTMQAYGMSAGWDDDMGDGLSFADGLSDYVLDTIKQYYCIDGLADRLGIERGAELEAELDEIYKRDIESVCGENGSEEEFEAFLAGRYISPEVYRFMNTVAYLNEAIYAELYGENSEKVTDEQALSYLDESGLIYNANHILLMSTADDGTELSEQELAERYNRLAALAEELRALENEAERLEKFEEYKQEIDEDGGKVSNPHGYVFGAGQMVSEFEAAVESLADYEISEPVETSYGYHIVIRLPLTADTDIDGSGNTARTCWASSDYGNRINELYEQLELEYQNGFEGPEIKNFI